ncbi:MAG: caspase family protein [Pseudomonadota bacterium]
MDHRYAASHALIVGIDKYRHVSPLSYAVSDAEAIKQLLSESFGFPNEGIRFLANEQATRSAITEAFLEFAADGTEIDDRLLVFYAGHGHTVNGVRGEVGYLVPHDADLGNLSTLIRWDELTRNVDLIKAKHVLFVMDACYGGLALNRNSSAGSARFLKDMLLRYSRQVLTAGKADEVVADSGGPLPDHSVFTGHLIEGLQGNAADPEGVLTANALMSYVYRKVSSDKDSHQTPHYGYADGDGDFIFSAPGLDDLQADKRFDVDRLVVLPQAEPDSGPVDSPSKVERCKQLLAEESSSISLHDFVISEVKSFLLGTSVEVFPVNGSFSQDEFLDRMSRYEEVGSDLAVLSACLAYWAKESHFPILQKLFARIIDGLNVNDGLVVWLSLRWYPIIKAFYCAGIAAIDGKRYDSLFHLFGARVQVSKTGNEDLLLAKAVSDGVLELTRSEVFKHIPGHERQYVPMSEYLFKELQPKLDEALFVGKAYETSFEEFEVLFALAVADFHKQNDETIWGPIGRFGWKHKSRRNGPFDRILNEAERENSNWLPSRQGMFGGSTRRFLDVAHEYREMINKLNWF